MTKQHNTASEKAAERAVSPAESHIKTAEERHGGFAIAGTEVQMAVLREEIRDLRHALWCADVNADGYREHVNELRQRAEASERDRDHWKANHADVVARLKVASERPDLPVDRIPAIKELERLQALAARQAPDLSKLTRYDFDRTYRSGMTPAPSGYYFVVADVQSLLAQPLQQPAPADAAQGDALTKELQYATDIATAIWRDFYKPSAPDWKPLPGLMGMLSQIDNMTAGMRPKKASGEAWRELKWQATSEGGNADT